MGRYEFESFPVWHILSETGLRGDEMKSAKRKRRSSPALTWLEDVSGRSARITSLGRDALLVENHRGIRSFSEEEIHLDTLCGGICVHGDGLRLCQVRPGALIIRGGIRQVHLPCEGGRADEP